MTYKFDLYIGSDNGSRRIGREYLDKIIQWADTKGPFTMPSQPKITHGKISYPSDISALPA